MSEESLPKALLRMLMEEADRLGLRPGQIADRIGISRQSVYYWRRGKSNPRWDTVELVMQYLGVEAVVRRKGAR